MHVNTLEGLWTRLRNFLRPFRGVNKVYLYQYVAMSECGYNIKFTVRFVPPAKRAHELPKDDGQAPINNSIGMTLKLIPAGEFFMGSPDDAIEAEKDEKPSHRVRISKPFYLGVDRSDPGAV